MAVDSSIIIADGRNGRGGARTDGALKKWLSCVHSLLSSPVWASTFNRQTVQYIADLLVRNTLAL